MCACEVLLAYLSGEQLQTSSRPVFYGWVETAHPCSWCENAQWELVLRIWSDRSNHMLVVVLCGYPASGKSTVSSALEAEFSSRGILVDKISDGAVTSCLRTPHDADLYEQRSRSDLYKDASAEKTTRAQLLAATERAVAPKTVVLVDSLNYIKGFRYELYCVSKANHAKYMVVYCQSGEQLCAQRDAARKDSYGNELLNALIRRFEMPEPRNRWDSPLVTIDCNAEITDEKCLVEWKNQMARVVEAGLDKAVPLRATMATKVQRVAGADLLNELDRATRNAEAALVAALRTGAGPGDRLVVPGTSRAVVLPRRCKVTELRGMRRAHIDLARLHPPTNPSTQTLVDSYIDYVISQLNAVRDVR